MDTLNFLNGASFLVLHVNGAIGRQKEKMAAFIFIIIIIIIIIIIDPEYFRTLILLQMHPY
jgi:hypothetical protein